MLERLFLDTEKPNQAQLKLYSKTAADLSKALLFASGAILFLPEEGTNLILGLVGIISSGVLFIAASRMLKGVKN